MAHHFPDDGRLAGWLLNKGAANIGSGCRGVDRSFDRYETNRRANRSIGMVGAGAARAGKERREEWTAGGSGGFFFASGGRDRHMG